MVCCVCIIVHCLPMSREGSSLQETACTLRFAQKLRKIPVGKAPCKTHLDACLESGESCEYPQFLIYFMFPLMFGLKYISEYLCTQFFFFFAVYVCYEQPADGVLYSYYIVNCLPASALI
jgi:hypothetical protein